MATLRLLEPVAPDPKAASKITPRVESLQGKRVGVRIAWPRFEVFMNKIEPILKERYGVAQINRIEGLVTQQIALHNEKVQEWENWHKNSDVAILGLGA